MSYRDPLCVSTRRSRSDKLTVRLEVDWDPETHAATFDEIRDTITRAAAELFDGLADEEFAAAARLAPIPRQDQQP